MNIIPNISASSYTISAFVVGYLLIDELTPAEQNSLGSWFMLLGQTLCSNSAQQQLLNNRNNISNSYNNHLINDNNLNNYLNKTQDAYNTYLKTFGNK